MALHTLLLKISEDERSVRYRFGPDEKTMGVVELDLLDEVVRELERPTGTDLDTDLMNARKALARLWARGQGYPGETVYQA